ncbi:MULTISPECIES: sensor histidine kinase [Halomonadaceae]|uniref:histidine kinase n=1 Tax=Billgrantia aerodenitrificans TaxID=2733483 RepID=A0ABS9ALN1_9GAMM|nr:MULTISPECIES: HAMP domain-containing sensor histidine kinase [Halomonas]MCE8022721.1 HAMP domain-containing histidine kinase [Halomonas aerodenitrificans]MCE8037878.1 HAMP domain-containing histidine kinase [Halomonas sp. MCCC 1A11062]
MTKRVSRRWRPRSLLQLVLLAFLVVMLPLGVLMYQAGQALSELSHLADVSARQAVEESRRARVLSNLAVEMERSARQYAVLEQESLLELYAERHAEFTELLAQQRRFLPGDSDVLALEEQLLLLSQLPELEPEALEVWLALFVPFAEHTEAMRRATSQQIDASIEMISARAEAVQSRLWLQTTALVSASLLLILVFSWLIIRPVRQLERRILSIGSGVETNDRDTIQGPAELVQLGDRLDWLSTRLSDLEAQKQQFLRHMSHELKTPLASVREGSALLADGVAGEITPRQREILTLIDASGSELQRLIEQLLDYNLLQHNQRVTLERVDLATLVKTVLSKHRLALEHKGMRVTAFDGPMEWVVDRTAVGRILDNLVSNAIAYGEDGGDLMIRAHAGRDHLFLDVANTGEPICEQDRPLLFEPFYQGRSRRKGPLKGSGIGLSVAADCARIQSGGLALVEDREFDVCFRLTLPWQAIPLTQEKTEPVAMGINARSEER